LKNHRCKKSYINLKSHQKSWHLRIISCLFVLIPSPIDGDKERDGIVGTEGMDSGSVDVVVEDILFPFIVVMLLSIIGDITFLINKRLLPVN